MANGPTIQLFDSSRSNGHFSPLSLSIVEEASADAAWRPAFSNRGKGIRDPEVEGAVAEYASTMEIDSILQSLTSLHEHNHFATHTGSAYGLLITYVHLLRHCLLVSMARVEHTVGGREILALYDQVLLSLLVYTPEWTQAKAVSALNSFFGKFTGGRPVLKADNAAAPACLDPRFAYVNLLESTALLVETQYAASYAPGIDTAQILRMHDRDHLVYFSLLDALRAQVGLDAPAQLAIKLSLAGPVPVFGMGVDDLSEPIGWEAFHPGYRLAHMVAGAGQTLSAAKSQIEATMGVEAANTAATRVEILDAYLETFNATSIMRYCSRFNAREGPLSLDLLDAAMSERGKSMLETIGFPVARPVLNHAIDAFNETRRIAARSFPLAHMSQLSAAGDPAERFAAAADRTFFYALFSVFDGEVRSVYFDTNPDAVVCAVRIAIQSELLDQLSRGRSLSESRMQLQDTFARGTSALDEAIKTIVAGICEDMALAEGRFER